MDPRLTKAAAYWSQPNTRIPRMRWWESKLVCRHINKNICGITAEGSHGGDIELLKKVATGRKFENAISVGCGSAFHELKLLEAGVVGKFSLFELSERRAQEAAQRAQSMGLSDRVSIYTVDAFTHAEVSTYDLVYWKDALHHMLDAHAAVQWSRKILRPEGVFFMNEFVGPTHMQYTDRQLDLAEKVRKALPDHYLVNPHRPSDLVPKRRNRPELNAFLAVDPTECADSANILPAVRHVFPDAHIIPTGGVVYMLALNDILANIDEEQDQALLNSLMLADDLCVELGETLYGVAYARIK